MALSINGLDIPTLRHNGVDAVQAYYMGHELLNVMPSTPEEWMQNLSALKKAADDLSANGESSKYYDMFNDFMIQDATFPVQLQNVDQYTTVEANKVMNCRIVGINCKDKADGSGKAGLTFMAKCALPKSGRMGSWSGKTFTNSSSTTGHWGSTGRRGDLNNEGGTYYSMFPTELTSVVTTVTNKYSIGKGSNGPKLGTSNDKFWLASIAEVYKYPGTEAMRQYDTKDGTLFPILNIKSRASLFGYSAEMNDGNLPSGANQYRRFWLRSVTVVGTRGWGLISNQSYSIDRDGSIGATEYPSNYHAIVPCFSI